MNRSYLLRYGKVQKNVSSRIRDRDKILMLEWHGMQFNPFKLFEREANDKITKILKCTQLLFHAKRIITAF